MPVHPLAYLRRTFDASQIAESALTAMLFYQGAQVLPADFVDWAHRSIGKPLANFSN